MDKLRLCYLFSILAVALDALTTRLCLRHFPKDTYESVTQSAYLFSQLGLENTGLLSIFFVIMIGGCLYYLAKTNPSRRIKLFATLSFLFVILIRTAASLNNSYIYGHLNNWW